MAEFLIAAAQVLCLAGLAYGAYLSLTYSESAPDDRRRRWLAAAVAVLVPGGSVAVGALLLYRYLKSVAD